jgi:hypothetical protein
MDYLDTVWVWTGSRLLGTYQGNTTPFNKVRLVSGVTAAWDPHTNSWTRLNRSPARLEGGSWAWTGKELIGWGPITRNKRHFDGLVLGPR